MGVDAAIDITTEERQTVLGLLQRHLPGTAAWVYGSRVKWTSTPKSDLDIVVFATPEQRPQVGDLREAFEESNLPFRVDLFVWDEVPDSFRTRIEAEHVALVDAAERCDRDGWIETKLGDVITLKRGYDLPERDRRNGSVPVVSSSGITDHHSDSKVSGPGVVTGRYGTLGLVFFVPTDFWPLNTALYVRDFKGNDPRFISYFLRSLDFSNCSDKAAVPGLNRNHLHEEAVRIPATVAAQRAIAHVLGTLDDKIELNRRMNATLEAMARALFRSWFVDFDPVRAKMEGRDTGLPTDIADLFPDRLVDSELGDIPQGWRMWRLEELANHHAQFITPSSDPEAEFDLFSLPAHDTGQLPARVTGMAIGSNKALVPPNAVLLSKLNPEILRVWMPEKSSGSLQVCSTEFIVFTPRSPATRSLLFSLFSDANFREMLQSMVTGTSGSHQRVPANGLKQRQVLPGTRALLRSFGEIVTPILAHTVEARAESRSLAALRDALLPKLVSGELRVNTLEPIARDDRPASVGADEA